MRKRTRILALATGALCVISVIFVVTKPADKARYQEVTLTNWLKTNRAGINRQVTNADATAKTAAEAVCAMNGEALRLLVKWISFRPARWRMSLVRQTERLPLFAQNSPPVTWLRPDTEYERLGLVTYGFAILGSNAIPAIPALSKLAADPNAPGAQSAVIALIELGPSAVPALSNLLTSRMPLFAAMEIRRRLGQMGPRTEAATVALVGDLTNVDAGAAAQSAVALGWTRQHPEIVVPALTAALHRQDRQVRSCAATALGQYGEAARPAVPKLRSLLGTDSNLDKAIRRSLAEIAPEVLTNAPVK